jgi:Protein of unknown function (DUF1569)
MVHNILLEAAYKDIYKRLESLQATNTREWGKMEIAQMLAHCSVLIEEAVGKTPTTDSSNFLSKTLIKWAVLSKKPFGKNLQTLPIFVVADERIFEEEKQRLLENVKIFYEKGQKHGEFAPHPGFGKLSKEDWGFLIWKHLDHHLQQFSA